MTVSPEILRRIASLRLEPSAMAEVLAIVADVQQTAQQHDLAAAERRRRDAERKRLKRASAERPRTVRKTSADTARTAQPAAAAKTSQAQDVADQDQDLSGDEESKKERSPTPPKEKTTSPQKEDLFSDAEVVGSEVPRARARGAGADWPRDAWGQFYAAYPHKVGKDKAERTFAKLRRSPRAPPWDELMAGLDRYKAKTDDRPWCNPSTFLNQGRWKDQPAPQPANNGNGQHRQVGGESRSFGFATYARRLAGVGAG